MTGTVDVNLTSISNSVDNGFVLGSNILNGVSTQGMNIGQAVGLTMTVGLYIGLLALVIVLAFVVVRKVKGFGGAKLGGHI